MDAKTPNETYETSPLNPSAKKEKQLELQMKIKGNVEQRCMLS